MEQHEGRTVKVKARFDPRVTIGRELRMFRSLKGWTLAEMGQVMDVPMSTVAGWEKRGTLTEKMVERLQKLVPYGFGFDFLQKSRELAATAAKAAKEVREGELSENSTERGSEAEKDEIGVGDAGK